MSRRVGVIANPTGERWAGFSSAGGRFDVEAVCIPWTRVLAADPSVAEALASVDLVRVDSPAGDAEVDRLLCGRRREPGEVLGAARWATAMGDALRRIAPLAWQWAPPPEDVDDLMDKAACHARLLAAGIPVVPALRPVAGWEDLVAAMGDAGWHRVFVKPRYGSSGSGVIALAVSGGRVRAWAHLDVEPTPSGVRLYNRRRLSLLRDARLVAAVVDSLAPEGLHVERWAPKVVMGGGAVDFRVVCVAGRATHVAARRGAGPLTNLHAGGRRADLAAVREELGSAFDSAVAAAERVAACFPGCLQVGVDVGVLADRRSVAVFEANAFGDLLYDRHDLAGRRRSTWDAQAAAIAHGWRPAPAAVPA